MAQTPGQDQRHPPIDVVDEGFFDANAGRAQVETCATGRSGQAGQVSAGAPPSQQRKVWGRGGDTRVVPKDEGLLRGGDEQGGNFWDERDS